MFKAKPKSYKKQDTLRVLVLCPQEFDELSDVLN